MEGASAARSERIDPWWSWAARSLFYLAWLLLRLSLIAAIPISVAAAIYDQSWEAMLGGVLLTLWFGFLGTGICLLAGLPPYLFALRWIPERWSQAHRRLATVAAAPLLTWAVWTVVDGAAESGEVGFAWALAGWTLIVTLVAGMTFPHRTRRIPLLTRGSRGP